MKNKKELIIYIILVILILLTIVYLIINKTNKEKDNDIAIDKITDIDTTVDLDNSDETINWDNYQTKDLTLTDSITITTGGIYNLSGTITDENENTILEYTPTKTYQAITVSSSKLKKGTTYTIKIDNETYTSFTVSSISTTVGTSNRMNNGGNMPGNGENPNNGNESAGKPNGNQPERK